MGNKQQLWWDLPAVESFNVLRELYEVTDADYKQRLEYLASELQLTDKLDTQVRKLSLGERMKCELVAALLHQPEVVFLDEPTIGLDLVSQKRIRDFLRELNRATGCTIVLTSHYMQDVEELCKRVVVIDHGSLVFDGEIHQLVNAYGSDRQLRLTFSPDSPLPDLSPFGIVIASAGVEVTISVPKDGVARAASQILQAHPVVDMAIEEVAVEEVVRRLFEQGR
jgi:ABC-2 type transport system ATP-binding protein